MSNKTTHFFHSVPKVIIIKNILDLEMGQSVIKIIRFIVKKGIGNSNENRFELPDNARKGISIYGFGVLRIVIYLIILG
jgi:hypothetical protein